LKHLLALAAALLGCACASSAPPPPAPVTPPAVELPPPPANLAASPVVVEAPPPDPPPPPAAPLPPFPPPAFAPPYPHTGKPGDGTWAPLAATAAPSPGEAGEPALLYRTLVHPDPTKTLVHVTLVAVDLHRVALRLVAGTREPLSATVPEAHRPGLVPAEDQPDLLAVMNGGFMTRHGTWGMKIGADLFLPPHDDGCTVALLAGGGVRIATYSALAGDAAGMLAYRQTPPCLVEERAVNPAFLGADKPRRWGMSETGGLEIRRSALGVADGGRTLIYGLGEGITPRALSEAMLAAGAVSAAELDVNWSYTRFFLYGPGASAKDPPEVTGTLIPRLKHAVGEYVRKPAERDFFYFARRQSLEPSKSSAP
jgi:hypothetical protein